MAWAVIAVGFVAEIVAWSLVARGRSVWTNVVPVLGAMGVAALVVDPPAWSTEFGPAAALGLGLAAGAALFAATRLALLVLFRWPAFAEHTKTLYLREGSRSLATQVALSIAISAPGEELFWRGLVQGELTRALDEQVALAGALGWLAYVVANLPSRSLAIAAGAIVGGAVWTALAWWTGGIGASLASHAVWTALMLGFPASRRVQERTA